MCKNTGVGCHFLLQSIFLTQGPNLGLLHILRRRWVLHHWATTEQEEGLSNSSDNVPLAQQWKHRAHPPLRGELFVISCVCHISYHHACIQRQKKCSLLFFFLFMVYRFLTMVPMHFKGKGKSWLPYICLFINVTSVNHPIRDVPSGSNWGSFCTGVWSLYRAVLGCCLSFSC